jgi:hypothetical protein
LAKKLTDSYEIRERFKPSFTSNYSFQQKINKLHTGAQWECKIIKITGDLLDEDGKFLTEEVELWARDPVECIRELIGNVALRDHIAYICQQVFTDRNGETRRYDEMWTGEWWWKIQASPITS